MKKGTYWNGSHYVEPADAEWSAEEYEKVAGEPWRSPVCKVKFGLKREDGSAIEIVFADQEKVEALLFNDRPLGAFLRELEQS